MRSFPKCKPDALPEKLRKQGLFCLWRYETVNGRPDCKVPYNPITQGKAQANNPETFADIRTAENAAGSGFDGLGIGLFGSLAAIDIDHCIDDNGQLSVMAADIVEIMGSYTERSPSGTGLRILFLAPDLQYNTDLYYIKNSSCGLEIYIAGMTSRYVTVTGDKLNSYDIEQRTDAVQTVIEKYMKRPQKASSVSNVPAPPVSMSDAELISKAGTARNGKHFASLWHGQWEGTYPSQSEADQALCNQLAFWTGGDPDRIDNLFRRSGLMRDKWDKREKYRTTTIQNAIDSCREFYTPYTPSSGRPQAAAAPSANDGDPAQLPPPVPAHPKRSSVELFDLFFSKIQTNAYKPIKTGMDSLDGLLGGGFCAQSLVMVGAAPGMGKTTFVQQLCETMARNGTDVVFLNLEMSREQLLARSISRETHKYKITVSAADVMRGYKWTEPQRKSVQAAAASYRNLIAPHMQYNPDGTGATLTEISGTLENALASAQQAGKDAPIVVLDYLQLVQSEARQDAQETIKAAVKMLKDYAIKGNTVSIAIIAHNRSSNANGKVTLESGRDTSGIEYSADTLLGMNFEALEDGSKSTSQIDELLQENPRRLVLKLLKQRMTAAGGKLGLLFDGESGTFSPVDTVRQAPQYGGTHFYDTDQDDDPDNPFISF